jgi:phage terminase large subunit
MPEIYIPRKEWSLRPYQGPLWNAAMEGKNICGVWHRRAGKDEVLLNAIGVKAIQRPASYAYMFPEISHARRSMWNAVNPHTGKRRILETFPEEIVSSINETDMRIDLVTGSNILFFGSDQYDRIVGAGLAGVVSSEHALAHPAAYAYFSPMLRENNGPSRRPAGATTSKTFGTMPTSPPAGSLRRYRSMTQAR